MVETNPALANIFSDRLQQVVPSQFTPFSEQVSHLPNILKLTIGEPDFAVPDHIKAAAVAAIEADDSHYSVSAGSMALRQAAQRFLAERYQLAYDAATEILTTVGATEGLFTILSAVLNPGDEVLIPTPYGICRN